jgi:micrococcal nuclease
MKRLLVLGLVALAATVAAGALTLRGREPAVGTTAPHGGGSGAAAWAAGPVDLSGTVVRVLDGRTIEARIGDRVETVRYLGIEVRGDQAEAARFNRDFVTQQRVRLELDGDDRDRTGRLLAYVWVGDVMINAELIAHGHARVLAAPPHLRHHDHLLQLEREAKLLQMGSSSSPSPAAARLRVEVQACPATHPIKATPVRATGERCVYRTPEDPAYARTRARRCYASEVEARQDGCRLVHG